MTPAQRRTLAVVWLTYGSLYVCRVNIGPARVEVQNGVGIGALEMGLVLGALKLGYALGQFINGQLVERFGPKRVLLTGMLGSCAACLAFAASPQIFALPGVAAATGWLARGVGALTGSVVGPMAALLIVIWLVNGFMQAGGWPPCVEIIARFFSTKERGKTMGILGTSYQLGTAFTLLACGWLVSRPGVGWRVVFVVPSAVLLLSTLHTARRLDPSPPLAAGEVRKAPRAARPFSETIALTLSNPRLWVLAGGLFGLDLVRFGFLDWAPSHLKEVSGSSVTVSALKVAIFPLAGALGALTSGWLTDRFFASRRAPVIAILLGLVAVFTLTYDRVVTLGTAPTVLCLFANGFCLFGAQVLLVGTAAQDFAKAGTAGAAAGFVDFAGSMGSFAGDLVTGAMVKRGDWHGAIVAWAGAAIGGAILVSFLWKAEAERPVVAATQ